MNPVTELKQLPRILTNQKERFLQWFMGPYYDGSPAEAVAELPRHPNSIFLGGSFIPPTYLDPHTLITGCTESGKTLCLRAILRSAMLDEHGRLRRKCLLYDGKNELTPLLLSLLGISKEQIYILNPRFVDATPWWVAKDLVAPSVIESCAAALFPSQRETQPFFREAATAVIAALMKTFARRGVKNWTLYHAFAALSHRAPLEYMLLHGPPEVRSVHERFLQEYDKTTKDIVATLTNGIGPYLIAANLWEHATRPALSIKDWVKSEEPSVLCISAQEESKKPLDAINRMILHRVHVEMMDLPDGHHESPNVWLFLDEVHRAGKLEFLPDFMTASRSKGAGVVLTMHTIKTLRAIYGPDLADVLTAMCGNKIALRTNDKDTSQFLQGSLGGYEDYVTSFSSSESTTSQGTTTQNGTTSSLQERYFAPWHIFQTLPRASAATGLPGIFSVPGARAPWRFTVPGTVIAETAKTDAEPDDFPLHDAKAEWSRKLNKDDIAILGLDEVYEGINRRRDQDFDEPNLESES